MEEILATPIGEGDGDASVSSTTTAAILGVQQVVYLLGG